MVTLEEFIERRPQLVCSPEFVRLARFIRLEEPGNEKMLDFLDRDHNTESMHDACVRVLEQSAGVGILPPR